MSNYAVINPATGETVKSYQTLTDAELQAAIASADEAHRTWSRSSTVEERAALIRRVGELHVERRQELAEIIVREMGKPIEQALGEVDFAGAIYEYYADHSADFLKDEPISAWKLPERLELRETLPMTPSGKVQKYQLREEIARLLGQKPLLR